MDFESRETSLCEDDERGEKLYHDLLLMHPMACSMNLSFIFLLNFRGFNNVIIVQLCSIVLALRKSFFIDFVFFIFFKTEFQQWQRKGAVRQE